MSTMQRHLLREDNKSLSDDSIMDFALPPELEASEPPEERGLARDEVRLMISYRADNRVVHTRFNRLEEYLAPGDLLVINTSGTLNAALRATRTNGTELELHLSTHLPVNLLSVLSSGSSRPGENALWSVEVRDEHGKRPFFTMHAGEILQLPGGATATLHTPYRPEQQDLSSDYKKHPRLWVATLHLPCPLNAYLAHYGFPIRYSYVKRDWPISYYQTVYATEPGSAEMPSAGRAFTQHLITRLVARGVQIAPLLLHTGVASLEEHEPPYEEYYRVPTETARLVNATRLVGRRVIAVGTTVVRALETVTATDGTTHAGEGWTGEIITPQRGIHAVQGLLTGLHEPRATHLAMLEALVGREHLQITYAAALRNGYLWHEFGDLHLLLP